VHQTPAQSSTTQLSPASTRGFFVAIGRSALPPPLRRCPRRVHRRGYCRREISRAWQFSNNHTQGRARPRVKTSQQDGENAR
jgi:hypothetical protein